MFRIEKDLKLLCQLAEQQVNFLSCQTYIFIINSACQCSKIAPESSKCSGGEGKDLDDAELNARDVGQ